MSKAILSSFPPFFLDNSTNTAWEDGVTGIGKGQWIQFSKTANGTTNPVQAYANVAKNKIFICKFIYNKELSHHYRKVKLFNSSLKYTIYFGL